MNTVREGQNLSLKLFDMVTKTDENQAVLW